MPEAQRVLKKVLLLLENVDLSPIPGLYDSIPWSEMESLTQSSAVGTEAGKASMEKMELLPQAVSVAILLDAACECLSSIANSHQKTELANAIKRFETVFVDTVFSIEDIQDCDSTLSVEDAQGVLNMMVDRRSTEFDREKIRSFITLYENETSK